MSDEQQAASPSPGRFFAHPAVLIILTALLTGLMVPWVTTRWEKRDKAVATRRASSEKELSLKTALVKEVGVASARFLGALETSDGTPDELNAPYRAFEESQFDVASQLSAYIPGQNVLQAWLDYAYTVHTVYTLASLPVGRARDGSLVRLRDYFKVDQTIIDGLCFGAKDPVYPPGVREIVLQFENAEARVVARIVHSPTVLGPTQIGTATAGEGQLPAVAPGRRSNTPCTDAFAKRKAQH